MASCYVLFFLKEFFRAAFNSLFLSLKAWATYYQSFSKIDTISDGVSLVIWATENLFKISSSVYDGYIKLLFLHFFRSFEI